jgi:hypothetical protein
LIIIRLLFDVIIYWWYYNIKIYDRDSDGDGSSYDDNICSDSYGNNNICGRNDGCYSNDYIDSSYVTHVFWHS